MENDNTIPTILNILWPGVGQLIQGQIYKGITLMIFYAISCLMIFLFIGFITTPLLWLYSIYDSYNFKK